MTDTTIETVEAVDIKGICEVLEGKIRGNPVAVSLFYDEIPAAYKPRKVDPCAILRHSMDDGEIVHFDRENQDCLHGAYITGVHEGTEVIRTGHLISDHIPAYTDEAAYKMNSGQFILPQGTVKAIGTAPLDKVPEGVKIDWMAVVCTPFWAGQIGAARSVVDGVQPSAAAGSSFCTDLFVTNWFSENVIMTPGDMGGRMNNKLKAEEMFVIIPMRWANNLVSILGIVPDAKSIFELTRPEDSGYWQKKANREARADKRAEQAGETAKKYKLKISMEWDEISMQMVSQAPKFVRKFAVGNIEDFAEEKGYQRITEAVVKEQMENAGMSKFMKMFKR